MNKHTPGPWKIAVDHHGRARSIESDAAPTWRQCWPKTSSEGRIYICEFRSYEWDQNRDYSAEGMRFLANMNAANAALIAAAPDLLDMLKRVARYVPAWDLNDPIGGKVQDLISRAEGRSSE